MERSSYYKTALICLNGHVITDDLESSPENYISHCTRCGEETIVKCPSCQAKIRGHHYVEGVIIVSAYKPPLYCHNCGKPYPWTERKQDAMNEIIDMNKKLNESEKQRLRKAIDDIIKETPYSESAILTLKSLINKLGKESWESIKSILIELLSETMKKNLGL